MDSICLVFAVIYLIIQGVKLGLAWRYVNDQRKSTSSTSLPDRLFEQFTIVQPILSGDPCLSDLLSRNVTTLPKEIRFIWLLDEGDTVGITIAETLINALDCRERIRLVRCAPAPINCNPKIDKFINALQYVATEYFVALDDDTFIDQGSLIAAYRSLAKHDLYTGLPIYQRNPKFWGDLLAHFVNNNSVLTYLAPTAIFGPLTINGMFYVTRSSLLRALAAFPKVRQVLCDDYAVMRCFAEAGMKVHQGISTQLLQTSVATRSQYFQIMHRWTLFAVLLAKDQAVIVQFALVLFLGLPPFLLLGIVISCCLSPSIAIIATATATMLLRYLIIRVSHRLCVGSNVSLNPLLSVVAEVLQPWHLVHGLVSKTIKWRSRLVMVKSNQEFVIY